MKLTQELINTLQGIHDGKPWQWRKKDSDEWHESIGPAGENFLPLKRVCKGYEIRLKPEPDPYAELKAAHAAGETIEHIIDGKWYPVALPSWTFPIERYRIKPDPYAEAKQAWLDRELQFLTIDNIWEGWSPYHPPSWDCDPSRYRRKPKPVRVPLGPEDVPPGSVFRMPDDSGWMLANEISRGSIRIGREPLTFDWLMQYGWLINRPANRDGNGNPTKWEPCYKEVQP